MLTIAIYLSFALLAGSVVLMLVYGLINLGRSGENKLMLAAFATPLVIAGIMMAVYGEWVAALIMTAILLMVLAFVLLVITAAQRLAR